MNTFLHEISNTITLFVTTNNTHCFSSATPPVILISFPLVSDAFELFDIDFGGQADRERPTLLQEDRETPKRLHATAKVKYPFGTFHISCLQKFWILGPPCHYPFHPGPFIYRTLETVH